MKRWLGWAAWLVPIALGLAAGTLVRRRSSGPAPIAWRWIIAGEVALAGVLGMLALLGGLDLPAAEAGWWGGVVGWGIAKFLADALGTWGRSSCDADRNPLPGVPLARAPRAGV